MIFSFFKSLKKPKAKVQKVVLIVLDGFGLGPKSSGNPITLETMPYINSLVSSYKSMSLVASGLVVGLEWGTYGNSEVGHSAIGTGRVVVQSLARINTEIRNKKFFKNDALLKVLAHAKKNNSKVHIIGCMSPGGIHSHEDHLIGLLEFFHGEAFSDVYVHIITDGEDSARDQGLKSFKKVEPYIKKSGATVASVTGRLYGMDRIKNWPLTKKAWDVMAEGTGEKYTGAREYIEESYRQGVYDTDIIPAVITDDKGEVKKIEDGDGIIFFNFRNDRMKQIVSSFVTPGFKEFHRTHTPKDLLVATMTNYSEDFDVLVMYEIEEITNTLGEILSNNGDKQLRLAETEKEAHVTNFFNGGKLTAYKNEDRLIVKSREKLDYLVHPEMKAPDITKNILNNTDKDYTLYAINFANSDMIAHTGNIPATTQALQTVDECLKKIITSVDLSNTAVIITADHGNSEELLDPKTKKPDTQHSTANVPIIFVTESCKTNSGETLETLYHNNAKGSLIDVAPTVLHLLGINKPKEMTGSSLVK